MTKLLGISGSLRRGSYNSALLRAATRLMPAETTLEVASIRGIPLYDYDVEAQGIPATVAQLKDAIVAADGVLLVTPEYNNGIPGVFKNAIDWLSRPSSDIKRVFGGRLLVPRAASVFDESGALKDPGVGEQLRQFLAGYVNFVRRPGP